MFVFVKTETPKGEYPRITISPAMPSEGAAIRAAEQDMSDFLNDDYDLIDQADIYSPPADDTYRIEYVEVDREELAGTTVVWEVMPVEERS